jgi:hypothetical protein
MVVHQCCVVESSIAINSVSCNHAVNTDATVEFMLQRVTDLLGVASIP